MKKNKNTREKWNHVVIKRLVSGEFAATSEQAEIEELGNMIANGGELRMDERGVLYGSNGNTLGQGNQTTVKNDPFAGELLKEKRKEDMFERGRTAKPQSGDILTMGTDGTVTFQGMVTEPITEPVTELVTESVLEPVTEPITEPITEPVTESVTEPMQEVIPMQEGQEPDVNFERAMEGGTAGEETDQGTTIEEGNITTITADPFAAAIPSNPDQWYNKNPNLFKAEVQYMFQRHPKAVYGFFKQTGNMYWIITLDIIKSGTRPWTFLLQYDKDHPNNDDYGGSIKVQLLKSPSLEDIEKRAKAFGRPGVPHLVGSRRVDGERYTYLCTRRPDAVESGVNSATSAVQVAAWAADWAAHFEAGMYNKEVWNQWCNDDHFRHLQI